MISKKLFHVHLYKVVKGDKTPLLVALLDAAINDPLASRIRKIGSQEYRMEAIEEPSSACPLWRLDFCRLRYDGGPGKASRNTPIESIELDTGEGFAEETAVLYDPNTGFAVVQYNHHGPRAGAIAEYLSTYDPDNPRDYELLLQLNPDAQARLDSKKFFTKIEIKVAPGQLSQQFRNANVALVTALERDRQEFGGDYVMLTVGLENRSNASLKLKKWLGALREMASFETQAVKTLVISGRDDATSTIDPVDLINEKLEKRIKDVEMDAGLRYLREGRWTALQRAYNGWVAQKIIIP